MNIMQLCFTWDGSTTTSPSQHGHEHEHEHKGHYYKKKKRERGLTCFRRYRKIKLKIENNVKKVLQNGCECPQNRSTSFSINFIALSVKFSVHCLSGRFDEISLNKVLQNVFSSVCRLISMIDKIGRFGRIGRESGSFIITTFVFVFVVLPSGRMPRRAQNSSMSIVASFKN